MIPSDHFVRFYNEIFKYLQKQGPEAIAEYYQTISKHQETHCWEIFTQKGIPGMKEYWDNIRKEENCDGEVLECSETVYRSIMNNCPSLSKVVDNDAGASDIYCRHCPGWVMPLLTKCGYYCVEDLVGLDIPRCQLSIFKNLEDARAYRERVLKRHPGKPELVESNFD
ncbi:MAG: hypothetical protein E7052_02880 [Lentisphaerae bacterium]|nr:hypothetical protein [Lentisphaerota bacterium]